MIWVRSLRVISLIGFVALVSGIVYSILGNVRPATSRSRPEAPEVSSDGARITQRAANVEILRTRKGSPSLLLRADESRTDQQGVMALSDVTFRLFGPGGRQTVVDAPLARSMPPPADAVAPASSSSPGSRGAQGPPEGIGSWLLEGGITVQEETIMLETSTLAYFEHEGQARTSDPVEFTRGPASGSSEGMVYDVTGQKVSFLSQVRATMSSPGMGQVQLRATSAVYDLADSSFLMDDYRAETARGEILQGRRLVARFHPQGGLESLEGERGFRLESTHPAETDHPESPLSRLLALEGLRTLEGERLAVIFDEQSEPVTIEISGDANLVANDLNGSGLPASVAAQTLVFDLQKGSLSRARASGAVDVRGVPATGETTGFQLQSDQLDAIFDPDLGSILTVEGNGEIQLSDEGLESQGSRARLNTDTDVITLTGEEGRPASAIWLERHIQARRIEADRKEQTLTATGGVRASYRPRREELPPEEGPDEAGALPFFRDGEMIYAMAESLVFAEKGQVASYREHVRLWQGESRIEASEIDLDELDGTLEARGEVISTFRQTPSAEAEVPENPSEQIVTIASSSMTYEHRRNRILYKEGVLITYGSMRITSDSLEVLLEEGGGSARSMLALGNVELREPGRIGRGDSMEVDMEKDTLRLTGKERQAIVQDESGQEVVKGRALTMDRTGDRILVESELGGRTWITLKPRQKGEPGIDADPEN